jgi:hypothetical protein
LRRIAQGPGAQAFDQHDHDMLHEVVGRRGGTQVPQSVKTHARCELPAQFGLCCVIDRGRRLRDAPCQRGAIRQAGSVGIGHRRIIPCLLP